MSPTFTLTPPDHKTPGGTISPLEPALQLRPLQEALARIDKLVEQQDSPALAAAVHWRGGASFPVHRWYRYREGYSPRIVEELELGKNVLDPFCGCGSAMIGAALTGRASVGFDINPLAVFAANVKLRPLSNPQLQIVRGFHEAVLSGARMAAKPWPVPSLRIATKLFEPAIMNALCETRAAIEEHSDPAVRDFLLLAWLAILEETGSYFKEGNGIKYRNRKRLRTGYVTRTEGEWQLSRFGPDQRAFAFRALARQLAMMLEDVPHWREGQWSNQRVCTGDALQLDKITEPGSCDSVVFSPPYANRFDYFESMKTELWFGGFVHSYEDLDALRKQSLRSHLGADLKRSSRTVPHLETLIKLMDRRSSSWRMRVPATLRGYFDDMFQVMKHCRRALPKDGRGRCCVVVGNSAYAGVIIPTDTLIALLGRDAGFSTAKIHVVRHLTVSSQQRSALSGLRPYMRESIVVLQ
jgi:hypothetical protein